MQAVSCISKCEIGLARLGVVANVAPGFLDNPKYRQLALRRQPPLGSLDNQRHLWVGLRAALEQQFDRREQAQLRQCGRAQIANDRAQLVDQCCDASAHALESFGNQGWVASE
jgi:hypothetical protein